MRELNIGSKKHTKVVVIDEPSTIYGACHEYCVVTSDDKDLSRHTRINFQLGPIKENGVNGCHNEDLIAIIIDRLQSFQAGDFSCRENALAITKLEEALMWLRKRTQDREDRGVEGTSVK